MTKNVILRQKLDYLYQKRWREKNQKTDTTFRMLVGTFRMLVGTFKHIYIFLAKIA